MSAESTATSPLIPTGAAGTRLTHVHKVSKMPSSTAANLAVTAAESDPPVRQNVLNHRRQAAKNGVYYGIPDVRIISTLLAVVYVAPTAPQT